MVVVDTSAWIANFDDVKEVARELEKAEVLMTPIIVLAEVVRVLKRKGKPIEVIEDAISTIKRESIILPLNEDNVLSAGLSPHINGMAFVDGIIYSYASADNKAISTDHAFDKPFGIYIYVPKKK